MHYADRKRTRASVYGKNIADVQAKVKKLESRPRASSEKSKQHFGVYFDSWLSSIAANRAPRTHQLYEAIASKHIIPHLGGMRLSQISRADIRQLLEQKLKNVGSRTRQLSFRILHYALEDAVDSEVIEHNPCHAKDKPKHEYQHFRSLTREEARRLLDTAKQTRHYALIYLALATGMRQGELFALRWEQVDLDEHYISVCGTLSRDQSGQLTIRPIKGKGRDRRVDIGPTIVELLSKHKRDKNPLAEWVFPNSSGTAMNKDNFMHRDFRPMVERAGLGKLRFHDLRHTSATLGLAAGENVKIVQERLGHASAKMTLDVYAKVVLTLQREAAARLDAILSPQGLQIGLHETKKPRRTSGKSGRI